MLVLLLHIYKIVDILYQIMVIFIFDASIEINKKDIVYITI